MINSGVNTLTNLPISFLMFLKISRKYQLNWLNYIRLSIVGHSIVMFLTKHILFYQTYNHRLRYILIFMMTQKVIWNWKPRRHVIGNFLGLIIGFCQQNEEQNAVKGFLSLTHEAWLVCFGLFAKVLLLHFLIRLQDIYNS